MSQLEDLQSRALEIARKYDASNMRQGLQTWGAKEHAMGFAVDVGELLELVMAKKELRKVDNVDAKLAHELADCLWSILVLAHDFNIDLEAAFNKTTSELHKRLDGTET